MTKLLLKESERPKIDPQLEEITEGEDVERKEKLKSRWAQLDALYYAYVQPGYITPCAYIPDTDNL